MTAVSPSLQPTTSTTLRFELRHSNLGRVAAVAAPVAELGLFGVLVVVGGIETESVAALLGLLWLLSLGHSWFVFGGYYQVGNGTLRIVHGPWRREFALTDVLRARPLRTLDRGPVIQLDLAYGRKLVLSPVEREAFLAALDRHPANRQGNSNAPHLTPLR